MRYYLVLFVFALIPALSPAQQAETLFSGDIKHGGFGSLTYGITSVNGEASYLRGTRGAWIIKFEKGHSLNVGWGGYRTKTGFSPNNVDDSDFPKLKINYGGYEMEYLNRANKLVHVGLQVLIGGGDVRYRDNSINLERTSDRFFIIKPGVNAHLNVTTWFRVSGGIFYRKTAGVDLEGTNDNGLSGISAIFGLRFGKF